MTSAFKRVPVEDLGWLICEASQGGGIGKCDPANCVCHGEAERLMEVFQKRGLMLAASPEPPAESAWRTIESAPAGVEVLVCGTARAGAYVALAKKIDGYWMMFSPEDDGFTVESSGHSHWQPLPAPPALSNKGG